MQTNEIIRAFGEVIRRCRVQVVRQCNTAGVHVTEKHYVDYDGRVIVRDIITQSEIRP